MTTNMDDKNIPEEKLTFAKVWEDFTETTGFHAVNKIIFKSKQKMWRSIFWGILWLLSAGYLAYIVAVELMNYYSYPSTITVTVRMVDELEFPAVTICNLATRNKSQFSNDTRTSNYHLRLSAIRVGSEPINWTDPFYLTENYFQERTMDDLYNESKSVSSFVQYHTFDLKDRAISITPIETDLGLCIRANVNNTLSTRLSGGLYNLQMYLNLFLDDDYYANSYLSSGVKVVVHDKYDEVLMVNNGFVVPPASEAFVEISKKEFKYLPAPYKAFENDTCEQKNSGYRVTACIMECYRQQILDHCGCVDFMFESSSGKYCSREKYLTCFSPTFWTLLRSAGTQSCDCPDDCEYTTYDTSLSFGMFPSAFIAKDLSRMLNETEESIRTNYINLKIYYKDLKTTVTEQIPTYKTVGEVFSNVGGQMGLFLGASILTVTELCEFLFFLSWYAFVLVSKRQALVYHGSARR